MLVLHEYHVELGRAITAFDGTIAHFAGDGAMILFNAPVDVERAIRAVEKCANVIERGLQRSGSTAQS